MEELRKMAKASSIEELVSANKPRKVAKASPIEENKNLETSTEEVAMLYQFQGSSFVVYILILMRNSPISDTMSVYEKVSIDLKFFKVMGRF